MADFDWRLIFKLDHFDLFGFDLVTYATVSLKPYEEAWQKGTHVFDAQVATEYLIFQHQVLRDFKASARFSAEGINNIVAHWGNISELRGKISFGRIPAGDLTLQVGPIPLNELESFGTHPLPDSLGGIFEGMFKGKEEIVAIASIPSRQTLYAQFTNLVNSPIQRFVVGLSEVAKKKV